MSPDPEARRLAAWRLAAARERVALVRRRVVVGAFSVFAAAWVGVFGQLATGEDPALGSKGTSSAGRTAVHRAASVQTTAPATSVAPATTVAPAAPAAPTVNATPLTTRSS
jgi:hypothetical protein